MLQLFLTGGGEQEHFRHLDKKFVSLLPEQSSILVLPLASEQEDHEDILEGAELTFHHKNIHTIDLIKSVEEIGLEDFLNYDALYIEGGNTFKLIQEVRNSHFFQYLEEFTKLEKSIYADSAGAIVLGSDIHTAFLGESADEDHSKLQDYRGLGLLGPWAVHCHYEPDDFEGMQDILYNQGVPILALAESVGIHLSGHQLQVYGDGSLEILDFNGRKSFPSGKSFPLSMS